MLFPGIRRTSFSPAAARQGFTLIELLIVIGIVATLSVVVVLVLNPAELLKQTRDSVRLSEMDTLHKALGLAELENLNLGATSTTYFSLIDPSATSSAGTNCAGIPLIPLSGWTYRCPASSTARNVNGAGWIPVNFAALSANPLSALPLDPINSSSTGYYYFYIPASSSLAYSFPESAAYF